MTGCRSADIFLSHASSSAASSASCSGVGHTGTPPEHVAYILQQGGDMHWTSALVHSGSVVCRPPLEIQKKSYREEKHKPRLLVGDATMAPRGSVAEATGQTGLARLWWERANQRANQKSNVFVISRAASGLSACRRKSIEAANARTSHAQSLPPGAPTFQNNTTLGLLPDVVDIFSSMQTAANGLLMYLTPKMHNSVLVVLLSLACAHEGLAFAPHLTGSLAQARVAFTFGKARAFAASSISGRLATVAPLRSRAQRRRTSGVCSLTAMFTGIVEEMGSVLALKEEEMAAWDSPGKTVKGVTLTLAAETVLEGAYEGCSIAVSATCSIT